MGIVKGIITALVTPFDSNDEILEGRLREVVEFQIAKGIHSFLVCGTTGQGPLMTVAQRRRVVEIVTDQIRKRVPVIAQTGLPDTRSTIELARHAQDHDVTAIACVTPYYYRFDRSAVLRHYKAVAASVSIPVFVYNIPRLTGFNVDAPLLKQLASIERVVGVKDSSRDFTQLLELCSAVSQSFTVLNGTDSFVLPAFLFGLDGAVGWNRSVISQIMALA